MLSEKKILNETKNHNPPPSSKMVGPLINSLFWALCFYKHFQYLGLTKFVSGLQKFCLSRYFTDIWTVDQVARMNLLITFTIPMHLDPKLINIQKL